MPPRAKKGSNKNKSNKGSAVTSGSNSGTNGSTSVDASLLKCDHCGVKLPKEWISSFQSITNCTWANNKAARFCGGCAQAYEAYTESFAKCASCNLPPPNLSISPFTPPPAAARGQKPEDEQQPKSSSLICCEECHHAKFFKNTNKPFVRYPFQTNGNGLEPGTPVHIHSHTLTKAEQLTAKFNVSRLNGNRGIILKWDADQRQHQVWVEGTIATTDSYKDLPLQNLRVIQSDSITGEDLPIIRPKVEQANIFAVGAVHVPCEDHKRKILTSILQDVTSALPLCIAVPQDMDDDGIHEKTSIADAQTRIKMFAVEKRQKNGYACVLSGWIELSSLIKGDSSFTGPSWGKESACTMSFFSWMASKAAMNALIEFLVQTPYIGPMPSSASNAFLQELCGINDEKLYLTTDQTHKAYIASMMCGPLSLLHMACCGNNLQQQFHQILQKPFLTALKQHHGAPLLLQRLSRWISRESLGTLDGLTLGPRARQILQTIMNDMHKNTLPTSTAHFFLRKRHSKPTKSIYDDVDMCSS